MSDDWYKAPFELTPYMDDLGRQWDPWTGEQVGGPLGDSPAERWFEERMGRKFGDPTLDCGLQFDHGVFSLDVMCQRMLRDDERRREREQLARQLAWEYGFGASTFDLVIRGIGNGI